MVKSTITKTEAMNRIKVKKTKKKKTKVVAPDIVCDCGTDMNVTTAVKNLYHILWTAQCPKCKKWFDIYTGKTIEVD